MNQYRLSGPQPSLLQRLVAAVVGALLIVALFFVGLFAWVLIAGFALVASVAFAIWFWRQKRRLAKLRAAHEQTLRRRAGEPTRGPTEQVIEGEFVVMTERKRRGEGDG